LQPWELQVTCDGMEQQTSRDIQDVDYDKVNCNVIKVQHESRTRWRLYDAERKSRRQRLATDRGRFFHKQHTSFTEVRQVTPPSGELGFAGSCIRTSLHNRL
jgi:hypothetical protein